jgi:hypothetical protein
MGQLKVDELRTDTTARRKNKSFPGFPVEGLSPDLVDAGAKERQVSIRHGKQTCVSGRMGVKTPFLAPEA